MAKSFNLRIVTPHGPVYDGEAEEVVVRTTSGDVGILADHIDYVAPLGMGMATIIIDGVKRFGACIGGMISVNNGDVEVVSATFEWKEDIDVERAKSAGERAMQALAEALDEAGREKAEAKRRRAELRIAIAGYNKK